MVEETKAWKTSDGKVFTSEKEAKTHEKTAKIMQWYYDNFIERDFDIELSQFLSLTHTFSDELIELLKKD